MPDPADSPTAHETAQWWLAVDDATLGPLSEADVISSLGQDGIDAQTPACPVGEKRWKPIENWPQFSGLFGKVLSDPPSTDENGPANASNSVPVQIHWIVAYCLLFRPLLWLLFLIADLAEGGVMMESNADVGVTASALQDHLLEALLVAAFVATGLHVRNLWRGADMLVTAVFAISAIGTASFLVSAVVALTWMSVVPLELTAESTTSATAKTLGLVGGGVVLLISLASLAFDTYVFVWWRRHRHSLRQPGGGFA